VVFGGVNGGGEAEGLDTTLINFLNYYFISNSLNKRET
jgi:hypothetical protein